MAKRAQRVEGVAGLGVVLGLLAAFLPWYSYSTTTVRVTVDAFRASILGDVFFLAIAATGLIVLMRRGLVADLFGGRLSERTALFAAAVCAVVAVLLQLILSTGGGRSLAVGLLFAVLAAAVLCAAAWMSRAQTEPRHTVRELLEKEHLD